MRDLTEINQDIARQEFYIGMARKGHKRYTHIEDSLVNSLEELRNIRDTMIVSKEDITKSDET